MYEESKILSMVVIILCQAMTWISADLFVNLKTV